MIVVSNASPLINLAVVGHLELLRQLYGSLKIPQAVSEEIIRCQKPLTTRNPSRRIAEARRSFRRKVIFVAVKVQHAYVEKRRGVCGGRAVITGTRIPVWLIFKRYRAGETIEEIQDAYRHLTPSQILDAIGYAFDHIEEITKDIEENSEDYWREKQSSSSSLSS